MYNVQSTHYSLIKKGVAIAAPFVVFTQKNTQKLAYMQKL